MGRLGVRRVAGAGDPRSGRGRISRPLTAIVFAVGWAVAVWVWPGLHLRDDAASLMAQPGVLIAAASITAAATLAVFAILGIILQVMARYSWAVVRSVLPRWFVLGLPAVVVAGVLFPLWVSFAPTSRTSTAAMACFGWSVLAVAMMAWSSAARMSPSSLARRTRLRALEVLPHERRRLHDLDSVAEALRQVTTSDVPLWGEGQRIVGVYGLLIAVHCREHTDHADTVALLRSLADLAGGTREKSGASDASAVLALWILGLDQIHGERLFSQIHSKITSIATEARSRRQRDLSHIALDAVADLTIARLCVVYPRIGFTVPSRTAPPMPPPAKSSLPRMPGRRFFAAPPVPSSLPARAEPNPVSSLGSRRLRRGRLNAFLDAFAELDNAGPEDAAELLVLLQQGLPDSVAPHRVHVGRPRPGTSGSSAYFTLCDTVDTLIGLLTAPLPSSSAWPSGWLGREAFDQDIDRLTRVARAVYEQSREVPSDAVEAALEQVGVRLLAEDLVDAELPAPRTAWRYPPTRQEEGGIATRTAEGLCGLMAAAYAAGFDRRALSTGLRLIALATLSAQRADAAATYAYTNALKMFASDSILHSSEATSQAGGMRAQALLTGLISECDQLLAAGAAVRDHAHGVSEAIDSLAQILVWDAPGQRPYPIAVAMLQVRIVAAGWPVELPARLARSPAVDDSVSPVPAHPLPGWLLDELKKELDWEITAPGPELPLALVLILWAHAGYAARDGDKDAAHAISHFLRDLLHEHRARRHQLERFLRTRLRPFSKRRYLDNSTQQTGDSYEYPTRSRELNPRVQQVIMAAIHWCDKANSTKQAFIPKTKNLTAIKGAAKDLITNEKAENWTYHGVKQQQGPDLVTVVASDGSRRILRDDEFRADQFSWGYGGTGPHTLATALVSDLLAEMIACPNCLGTSPAAAGAVACTVCKNTGQRVGINEAAGILLEHHLEGLPDEFELTRHTLLVTLADHARQ
jgi:hypothetical protein